MMSTICDGGATWRRARPSMPSRRLAQPLFHIPSLVSGLIDGADIAAAAAAADRNRTKRHRRRLDSTQLIQLMPISWKDVSHVTITRRDRPVRSSVRLFVPIVCLSSCSPNALMLWPCTLATWKMAHYCNYCRSRMRLMQSTLSSFLFSSSHAGNAAAAAAAADMYHDEKDL